MGLETLVIAILGSGGIGAAVVGLLNYFNTRHKAPAEVDSIIVTGAESAVITMQKINDAAVKRAEHAEAALAAEQERGRRKDERIALLEQRLDRIQSLLDDARTELAAVRRGDSDGAPV